MISGNRMVSKKQMQNQGSDPKPNIHKISDYNQVIDTGNAYQVIKPKKQNVNKVDSSLRPPIQKEQALRKPLHQNSQNPNLVKNEEKPKFMSVARHGMKIGGQVIGNQKWQCKVCKLVNLNSTQQCFRCQSEKGELKQGQPEVIKKPQLKAGIQGQPLKRNIK